MDKHLLILDLDETLIYGAEAALGRAYDFRVGQFFVYRRPFLTEFLAATFEWFDVAVWSSANAPYVHTVVGRVFPQPEALRFVWACDRCTQRFDAEELTNYWVKDLKKVKRLGYRLERVLMIDDTSRKLERHYGNHLRLRPFLGQEDDTELRDVLPFLNILRKAPNLRVIEKRNWRAHHGG